MAVPSSPFAFALCQPGSEKFLKAEMKRLRPDLHPAMQRPGLVSFKATAEPFDVSRPPRAVFARSWSASAGPASSAREIADLARALGAAAAWVSPRDQ
ncbi:MAG: hypothetical protein FJ090_15350, partial [Deltaproteobacteria bacterium]|nr:hypothetical protein [Deltaproteobacteria bacterium]